PNCPLTSPERSLPPSRRTPRPGRLAGRRWRGCSMSGTALRLCDPLPDVRTLDGGLEVERLCHSRNGLGAAAQPEQRVAEVEIRIALREGSRLHLPHRPLRERERTLVLVRDQQA